MIDLIFDIFQNNQIKNLNKSREIQNEKDRYQDGRSTNIEARLQDLEKRHEQLKLVTLSLWSLLRDHSGLMESDLRRYVKDIDLLDGKLDGKVEYKKEKINCSGCGRVQLSNALACAYCGGVINRKDPFSNA